MSHSKNMIEPEINSTITRLPWCTLFQTHSLSTRMAKKEKWDSKPMDKGGPGIENTWCSYTLNGKKYENKVYERIIESQLLNPLGSLNELDFCKAEKSELILANH